MVTNWRGYHGYTILHLKRQSYNSIFLTQVQVPPKITSKPTSVNLTSGSSVRLTCEASQGEPAPAITWRKDGQLLPKTPIPFSRYICYDHVFIVLQVQGVIQIMCFVSMVLLALVTFDTAQLHPVRLFIKLFIRCE